MKHILLLTWKDIFHPKKGGAEVVMYEYAKRLAQEGHKVTWFASSFKNVKSTENIDGIHIIRKFSIHTIYFFAWWWYKNFIKKNSVDIVIDEAGGIPLLSPLVIKNIPIYFFIHHIGEEEYNNAFIFPINKIFKKFVYWTFSLYKKYPTITVSESTKKELEQKFDFKKVSVIENATHLSAIKFLDFSQKKDEIVFLGRIMPMKRLEQAIFAFENFSQKNPTYTLRIIGNRQDEKYFQFLQSIIFEKGLQKKIIFEDYSAENVKKYFLRAKLLLVTSTKEGFGLVVLEGNVFGLPALAYDVPGLRDSVKNGINGYLIEDENFVQMSQKMQEILQDEKIFQQNSASAWEYLKNYGTWDDKYDEFKKIIFNNYE